MDSGSGVLANRTHGAHGGSANYLSAGASFAGTSNSFNGARTAGSGLASYYNGTPFGPSASFGLGLGSASASASASASGSVQQYPQHSLNRSILRSRSVGNAPAHLKLAHSLSQNTLAAMPSYLGPRPTQGALAASAALVASQRQALGDHHFSSSFNADHLVPLNQDPNPIVIRRKPAQPVRYQQNVSVKFLKPPPPPPAGDIVVRQERDVQAPPAPPHYITQKPPAPIKPAPQIIRERPPVAPPTIAPELHTIPGRVIPPPPRKVIVEKLPQLPTLPQDVIIERWLEFPERLRRVVYEPAAPVLAPAAPRNVHIFWEAPQVSILKEFKNLGIVVANPAQYAAQHGASLLHPTQMPPLAPQLRPGNGEPLAVEAPPKPPRFVGDVQALNLMHAASRGRLSPQTTLIPPPIVSSVFKAYPQSHAIPPYELPYSPFGSHYGNPNGAAAASASASGIPTTAGVASAASGIAPGAYNSGSASASLPLQYSSASLSNSAAVAPPPPPPHPPSAYNYAHYPAAAASASSVVQGSAFLNNSAGSGFALKSHLLPAPHVSSGSVSAAATSGSAVNHYAASASASASASNYTNAAYGSGSAYGSAGGVLDRGLGYASASGHHQAYDSIVNASLAY